MLPCFRANAVIQARVLESEREMKHFLFILFKTKIDLKCPTNNLKFTFSSKGFSVLTKHFPFSYWSKAIVRNELNQLPFLEFCLSCLQFFYAQWNLLKLRFLFHVSDYHCLTLQSKSLMIESVHSVSRTANSGLLAFQQRAQSCFLQFHFPRDEQK